MNLRPSAIVLLGVNALPLAGVVFLDWQVFDVLLLYWVENVVIGAVNVLRMFRCKPTNPLQLRDRRWNLIPFFIVHYGMFCWGHLTALLGLFATGNNYSTSLAELWSPAFILAVIGMFASHLFSFASNFLGDGEYRRTTLRQLMRRPYGRILVLHITIIAGGGLIQALGEPVYLLLVLVVVKTLMDVKLHAMEREKFAFE